MNAVWLGFWICFAVVGKFALPKLFHPIDPDKALLKTLTHLGQEALDSEQLMRFREREGEERRRNEIVAALGGPAQAGMKDPSLSLREALRGTAMACAPTNASIQVDVNRFTEFSVVLYSEKALAKSNTISFAREFLPLTRPYVDSVAFSTNGAVVAELDRDDIEFVADWRRAPDERIAMLLEREVPLRAAQDPAAIERVLQEQRLAGALQTDPDVREKAQTAERAFREVMQKAFADLNRALELLFSLDLNIPRTVGELDARERNFREAREKLKSTRAFFENTKAHWERALDRSGLAGESRQTLAEGFTVFFPQQSPPAKVFEAAENHVESLATLFGLFSEQFNGPRVIGEVSSNLPERISRAQKQVVEDARALDAAVKAR